VLRGQMDIEPEASIWTATTELLMNQQATDPVLISI
jgi:hypothetical protein